MGEVLQCVTVAGAVTTRWTERGREGKGDRRGRKNRHWWRYAVEITTE